MTLDINSILGLLENTGPDLSNMSSTHFSNVSSPFLAAMVRDNYRATFKARVAAGEARPFLLPHTLFATLFLPMLYMAIPHRNRPWLYHARWLVLAFIIVFNMKVMVACSSTNMSMSYCVGLMAFWGIMRNINLFVFSAPQFDFERVALRRKVHKTTPTSTLPPSPKPAADPRGSAGDASGLRKRLDSKNSAEGRAAAAPEIHSQAEYEHYWQAYPENGTFLERLGWVAELYTNSKGAGWSWGISSVPNPAPAERPGTEELVKMDTIPLETSVGCHTFKDEKDFLRWKLRRIGISYIFLDAVRVLFSSEDPYFVLGDSSLPLPSYLQALPSWAAPVCRHVLVLSVLFASIGMADSGRDLMLFYVGRKMNPVYGEVWRYSTIFGSFRNIFDRGLAGFWGGWWHQIFRNDFSAPVNWAVKQGYLSARGLGSKVAGMLMAFFLSGLLHAAGSVSTIPETNSWKPAIFFWLSGLGIIVQMALIAPVKPLIARMPRLVRRLGNFLFVAAWLHLTVSLLVEDFILTGLWFMEPVPISIVRALGFGRGEVSWWKPDWEAVGHWHNGQHWWDSGFSY